MILAMILASSALCACTQSDPVESVSDVVQTEMEEATQAEPPTEAATQAATELVPLTEEELAPADILSFEIELKGKALTIPFDYAELADLGYTVTEDDDLQSQGYTIGVYPENAAGDYISVQIYNPSDETKKYSQCLIGQLNIDVQDGFDLKLPGGLPFDGRATADDIIAKYGEPVSTREGDGYIVLEYGVSYSRVEIMIHSDPMMKKYDNVTMQNLNA